MCKPHRCPHIAMTGNICVYCFPASDTRVLTDAGFLFLDEIELRLAGGQRILYACYDTASGALMYRDGRLVEADPPAELITIDSDGAGECWDDLVAPYGLAANEGEGDDGAANSTTRQSRLDRNWRVSLRCTPDHIVFAQRGTAKSWESTRKAVKPGEQRNNPVEAAPAGRTAGSMLPRCDACRSLRGQQRSKQSQCEACAGLEKLKWERYRLIAAAETGHAVDESTQAGRRAVRDALQLDEQQFRAFLELFGFWIGDGSMHYPDAVLFAQKKESDRAWVCAQLTLCGLSDTQWSSGGVRTNGQEQVRVKDRRWFAWFDTEYGVKYRRSRSYSLTDERVEQASKTRCLTDAPHTPRTPTDITTTTESDEPNDPITSVKWFPDWLVMQLPPDELRLVLMGLWRADGSWATQDQEICTAGVRFRDQLVQLLLNAGCSPRARLKYKAGTIRGYKYFDQTVDCTTYPVSFIEELRSKGGWTDDIVRGSYTPIQARADGWAVAWSDFAHSQGSSVCLPILDRSRCFTKTEYSPSDGRVWCVEVDHPDHLIVAQRAERHNGIVTRQSRPIIIGNCPGGPDSDFEYSTQAYTGYEPTSMRAIRARYNPFLQTKNRVDQLKRLGHSVDKVEFIVMGGTFLSLDKDYRDYFIRNLHDALSGHASSSVAEAVRYSEQSTASKCTAITLETRPDYCLKPHLNDMLAYGCTRIEIGVQSIYEDVARDTNRGHTVAAVCHSFQLAKDAGYKIVAHMMPDLPNMGMERDLEGFREYFENPLFRTDGLKIYPTLVIRGTGLYELWKTGQYKNYSPDDLVDLMAKLLAMVPPWTRVYRIQRDIPMPLVTSGVEHGNLRELALARMKDLGLVCNDVRTREVGIKSIHDQTAPDQVELVRRDYVANGGWETFLSYEDPQQNILIGLLRLRRASPAAFRSEIPAGCSIVRELHVYGSSVPIHSRDPTKFQHQGFGTLLMEEAERIALEEHDSHKIVVIAGVGTRNYYRRLGYELDGPYMSKYF